MAIKLQAKKELRLVPLRFERATSGVPDIKYPEVDDRGHTHKVPAVNGFAESDPIRGGVVGLCKNQEISIQMVREDIDNGADLYLTSSDEDVFTLIKPTSGGKCATGKKRKIKIKGGSFSGSTPKSADLQVRFGAKDGPIVSLLKVYTFPKQQVVIQPINVTINDSTGTGGVAPSLNISTLMAQVTALWSCCGVELVAQATQNISVSLGQANQVLWAELNQIFAEKWEAGTINVYIVEKLENDALGYGFSKSVFASLGLTHPAAFLAMKDSTTDRSSEVYYCANDLAHELGHFFTLWHPSDGPSSTHAWTRFETWSMRFMMHNYNSTFRPDISHGVTDWPDFNDFGYGTLNGYPYRAGLISLKNVRTSAGAGKDGQCSEARNHIGQGPASLY